MNYCFKPLLLLIVITMTSCITLADKAKKGMVIPSERVVITGLVSFIPEPEQVLSGIDVMNDYRAFYLMIDNQEKKMIDLDLPFLDRGEEIKQFESVIFGKWNESFFYQIPRKSCYVKGIHVYESAVSGVFESIVLPMNIKIDIADTDEFIYIGDLTFMSNKKKKFIMKIEDNFDKRKSEYENYYQSVTGQKVVLKKKILSKEEISFY